MQTAGARILPEDEPQGMNREAVLLEWERKIEQGERRPGRFDRGGERLERRPDPGHEDVRPAAVLAEHSIHGAPRRFKRREPRETPAAQPRTITIGAHRAPSRRRRSAVQNQLVQPDRIALWAFLLGLFLVAVAAGTAHA
jgi:hypothetical protein